MKINPWLEERLRKTPGLSLSTSLSFIVEAEPDMVEGVRERLRLLGVAVGGPAFNMMEVRAPMGLVERIMAIPGVSILHYNMPVWIKGRLSRFDPLIGDFVLSPIEIPLSPQDMAARLPTGLIRSVLSAPLNLAGIKAFQNPDVIIIPTSETRRLIGAPEDNIILNTRVAILDTGTTYPFFLPPPHGLLHPLKKGFVRLESTTGEPAWDGLGHGQWCVTCAFGNSAMTRFGECRGVADPRNGTLMSVKCLSNLGFGMEFGIIKAIEIAYRWRARVISMSLGGPLQGPVDFDPMCRVTAQCPETIFVIAAGNEGPSEYSIGSPGASPQAVTVGAWSPYYNGLAYFSSRGPSGEWYRDHPDDWARDYVKYGENLVKPDLTSPGGGGVQEGQKPDLILSGVTGWMDGMYDMTPGDGTDAMRGTSQATPHAAGLIALLCERGIISSAADVKRMMARQTAKDHRQGYGLINWSLFQGG